MSRPRKVQRTAQITITLPQELVLGLQIFLWSEVQQRVPLGAYQEFFTAAATKELILRGGLKND